MKTTESIIECAIDESYHRGYCDGIKFMKQAMNYSMDISIKAVEEKINGKTVKEKINEKINESR